ncbi:hypothetical protein [Mycobacterium stomatepiae]|uniref:Uncharacterized protein n=1 Tax=Mycobacterium stomatepiae TaxID=470076 RepID=A0A7I7Q4T9_9MYCO|nr:hypothetical protein [Mycobacterium stomatepiae]MCV7163283.1 hypothetical protein [Mycobacterium stomatepiae]BBY21298.1 hypothetical protein MSTO_15030 [Mycobacterium stomatepiae]
MTVVERKLPGQPATREEAIREYESWRWANVKEGPGQAAIFALLTPKPEEIFRWRIQLDCGCIREVQTRGDDVQELLAQSDSYHFTSVKASERDRREANERFNADWQEDREAEAAGEEPPVRPKRPSLKGKEKLTAGQWLCEYNSECPRYRWWGGGPVREIVEWIRRRDQLHICEPLEIDGEMIGSRKEYAVWEVLLSCGHYEQKWVDDLDWKPEDGIGHKKPGKNGFLPLDELLSEIVKDREQDDERFWRRVYAENHPDPVPFAQCKTCGNLRSMVAYERVGFLAPKPKPIKPVKPRPKPRKTLERQLQKLEAEAAALRNELESRRPDE